jgi:molybdenum cofactor cytidylyltransferase
MGSENKLTLPFGNATIIETCLQNLTASNINRCIVVAGHDAENTRKILKQWDIECVINKNYSSGQMSSIKCGLHQLGENESFLIALADMPFITTEDYNDVLMAFQKLKKSFDNKYLRPVNAIGTPGHPVVFDSFFREVLLGHDDPENASSTLKSYSTNLHLFKTDRASYFKDIDTLEDYGNCNISG